MRKPARLVSRSCMLARMAKANRKTNAMANGLSRILGDLVLERCPGYREPRGAGASVVSQKLLY
jgi:hypothetical protein